MYLSSTDGKSFTSLMQSWAAEYKNIKDLAPPRPFHNRLVLQPSTIEASLLALERRETNPFLSSKATVVDGKQESSLVATDNVEVDVTAALKHMEVEEVEDMPGCVSSPVPKPSFISAVGGVMKLMRSFRSERQLFPKLVTTYEHHNKTLFSECF